MPILRGKTKSRNNTKKTTNNNSNMSILYSKWSMGINGTSCNSAMEHQISGGRDMTYSMWNFLLGLLLVSTLGLWAVHIYHLWQLHKLERRVKMLEAEKKR